MFGTIGEVGPLSRMEASYKLFFDGWLQYYFEANSFYLEAILFHVEADSLYFAAKCVC